MSIDHGSVRIIDGLSTAGVEYIVVGMTAAVLLGAPAVTLDLATWCASSTCRASSP